MTRAILEGDNIIISVSVAHLATIVEGAWAAGALGVRLKITDPSAFAIDLVHEMNEEDEGGTTRIHRFFDKSIEAAFEDGASGIEEHEKQEA